MGACRDMKQMKNGVTEEQSIEKLRQEAFLEGYQYAIRVLEEGLVKKTKVE